VLNIPFILLIIFSNIRSLLLASIINSLSIRF